LPFKVMCMSEADIVNRPRMSELEKRKTVMGADYVVWSDTHFDAEQSLDWEFQALFLQCKGSFSPIAEVTAVDDTKIIVYKRNS
jgi:hypothetical protein